MRKRAFTLVELLVVILVIAILAGLAIPAYNRMAAGSRATACVSNLRQLGSALNLYLAENSNTMPTMEAGRRSLDEDVPVIDNTLDPYLDSQEAFACPGDNLGFAATTGTSYFWNTSLNAQSVANLNFFNIEDRSRIPVLSDKEGFHPYEENRVNILFADGHATRELQFYTGN